MRQATLTPEAKSTLSSTVRGLRTRLIHDLLQFADGEYQFSREASKANLDDARSRRRQKLDAWIDEQRRAEKPRAKEKPEDTRKRWLLEAIKTVASTWLNRVVLIKHLEALELSKPKVITGGWNSHGYRRLRDFGQALLLESDTEGYGLLVQLLFEELSLDLPGLFGEVGLERLFPLPHSTLRALIETLDDPTLESAWTMEESLTNGRHFPSLCRHFRPRL